MMDTQHTHELIEAFGGRVEGGLAFDDEGRAAFAASDLVVLCIDHLPNTNQFLLHADLGRLPDGEGAMACLQDLAAESLELAVTLGGTFAFERASGTVALFARKDGRGLDADGLEDWIGAVAERAEVWVERLVRANARKAA